MPTRESTELAYDVRGTGLPVVFLHGLTFDRRTWRPIVDRLGEGVQSVAVDLPAHGESGGAPAALADVADGVHELLSSLGVDRPVVVGHSLSGALAAIYAAAHPTRGFVVVDQSLYPRPFVEQLHRLEPVLRGPGFVEAWTAFEASLGLRRIPEPIRSLVLETHRVSRPVVLGYWDEAMSADPAELQASIDEQVARIEVPCLGVFGRTLTDLERERFDRLRDVEVEEWEGSGHFVHLVDADRFTRRLREFLSRCAG
jgi:pimeloyl-ACP methyl ester carboxylesterase